MRSSRRHQRWSLAPALALLLIAGASTPIGRQDLGALFAEATTPSTRVPPLLLGGPLRTLKAAVFAWPSPPGAAFGAPHLPPRAVVVNRAAKGDRLALAPPLVPPVSPPVSLWRTPLTGDASSAGPAAIAAGSGPAGEATDAADDIDPVADSGAGDPTGDPAELEAAFAAAVAAAAGGPNDPARSARLEMPGDALVDATPADERPIYQETAFIFGADPSALPPLDFQHLHASVASAPDAAAPSDEPSPADRLGLVGKRRIRAETCLAEAVYFESRGEPERGQIGVAQVVINRVFSGYYPADVCRAVYQNANRHLACQFTFACDDVRDVVDEPALWRQAKRIAADMLDGKLWDAKVGGATHYHARSVRPSWVREMKRLVRIGEHTFYRPRRWDG